MPPPAALSASSSFILLSPPPSPKPKLPPFSPRKRSVAITPRRHPLHSAPSSAVRCAVIEKETPETHRPDTFLRENSSSSVRARFEKMIRDAQDTVCAAIEAADGGATFKDDVWSRPGGGGGISRVLQDGAVWEKAGVNVSVVYGVMPSEAYRAAKDAAAADHKPGPVPFFAAGVSSVLHSKNPFAPTLHFNYRYFETDAPQDAPGAPRQWWFGVNTDLTPAYIFDEDVKHFHSVCTHNRQLSLWCFVSSVLTFFSFEKRWVTLTNCILMLA